jgi:hypothetical protein
MAWHVDLDEFGQRSDSQGARLRQPPDLAQVGPEQTLMPILFEFVQPGIEPSAILIGKFGKLCVGGHRPPPDQ